MPWVYEELQRYQLFRLVLLVVHKNEDRKAGRGMGYVCHFCFSPGLCGGSGASHRIIAASCERLVAIADYQN